VTGPVRILIADDHAATRLGVRRALEDHEFDVVAEAADGPGAVRLARELAPDVCLLDVHMPGGGIEAAAEIVLALPDTRVVMLTVSSTDDDLFEALRVGASGYLLKETDPERLPFALRGALNGEAVLPRSLTARLIEEFRGRERRRHALSLHGRQVSLSDREWQVLELMREGFSTRAIAERLAISPVTVRRHLQAILEKLRVPSRRAALALLDGQPGGLA
jgi:DNA-binding NarL/FixJ family response regulator